MPASRKATGCCEMTHRWLLMLVAGLIATAGAATAAPEPGAPTTMNALQAGTGKAGIDPPAALFPIRNNADSPLTGIHDSLYARALVLKSASATAIVVVADLIMLPEELYERAVEKIAATYSVPKDHVFLSATHTHTVPWSTDNGYGQVAVDGILAAIGQAMHRMEAVRVGSAAGSVSINVNRDEAFGGGFILGQDPDGASDKAVRVVGFIRADGSPVAILANYAVHAVSLYSSDTAGDHAALVSADIPGVVDRFVDEHYGPERTETLWTSGAAGDQNPLLMSFYAEPQSNGEVARSDMKAAGFMLTERLGQALAREIIRVTDRIQAEPVRTPLRARQVVANCPSKLDPATQLSLRLSYLGIGPVDILGVSGEVGTLIDQHLRDRLPGRTLLMLTLTNGYAGYVPDDASYARGKTFEVTKTSFAPGCIEQQVVSQSLRLVGAAGQR
jgi:neutral ceramidase